jgi:hypothetical protein
MGSSAMFDQDGDTSEVKEASTRRASPFVHEVPADHRHVIRNG